VVVAEPTLSGMPLLLNAPPYGALAPNPIEVPPAAYPILLELPPPNPLADPLLFVVAVGFAGPPLPIAPLLPVILVSSRSESLKQS
jgi:hypothetical protein